MDGDPAVPGPAGAPWSARLDRVGARSVVFVSGEIDSRAHRDFAAELARLTAGLPEPVVDLSGVRVINAPGVRALLTVADDLASTGRPLRVVTGLGAARRSLHAARATDVLETYASFAAADGSLRPAISCDDGDALVERLRAEIRVLRARLASRPVIARALGIVQERYGLPDEESAFRLLRWASQQHNVRIRLLAHAVAALPRPGDGAWPPVDARPAAAPSFAGARPVRGGPAELARRLLAVAGPGAGYVQLAEEERLRLAAHQGLTGETSCLDSEETTSALALARLTAVTSADIATDPVFDGTTTRATLLGSGHRTALSLPLLGPAPAEYCQGVLTVLHPRAGHEFPAPVRERLDAITREAGRWLHRHREAQVLAALADLHTRATRSGRFAAAPTP